MITIVSNGQGCLLPSQPLQLELGHKVCGVRTSDGSILVSLYTTRSIGWSSSRSSPIYTAIDVILRSLGVVT